jgi:hypothetical protein
MEQTNPNNDLEKEMLHVFHFATGADLFADSSCFLGLTALGLSQHGWFTLWTETAAR